MDKEIFKKSCSEVFWLSIISFFPLVISIIFQAVKLDDGKNAILQALHPSELLAFCLSFLAPSIFFIKKTHGRGYKLPYLDAFFFTTLFMYIIALLFVFIIKNNLDPDVAANLSSKQNYLIYTAIFLLVTVLFRVYSTYHTTKSSDFIKNKKEEETDFTQTFKRSIHGN